MTFAASAERSGEGVNAIWAGQASTYKYACRFAVEMPGATPPTESTVPGSFPGGSSLCDKVQHPPPWLHCSSPGGPHTIETARGGKSATSPISGPINRSTRFFSLDRGLREGQFDRNEPAWCHFGDMISSQSGHTSCFASGYFNKGSPFAVRRDIAATSRSTWFP
jgi:hypothetical protein